MAYTLSFMLCVVAMPLFGFMIHIWDGVFVSMAVTKVIRNIQNLNLKRIFFKKEEKSCSFFRSQWQ